MVHDVILIGTDINGREHTLSTPSKLVLTRSMYTPADLLNCTISTENPPPELKELHLTIDGKLKFIGFVDNQSYSISPMGAVLTLSGRSRASVLLDNEAMPMSFSDATLRDIFNRYIKVHGFFVLDYPVDSDKYQYPYTVHKGTSQWEAFSSFCKMSYKAVPKFKNSYTIMLTRRPMLPTITISNRGRGDTNFISLEVKNDRYSPISGVSIRDNDGYYRSWVHNPENFNLKLNRERYLLPPSDYSTSPRLDADEKIRLSMRKKVTIHALLAGIPQLEPTNLMYIDEPGVNIDFTPVAEEVKLIISGDGVYTEVKGINPKYV